MKRKRKYVKDATAKILSYLEKNGEATIDELAKYLYGKENYKARVKVRVLLYKLRNVVEFDEFGVCRIVGNLGF